MVQCKGVIMKEEKIKEIKKALEDHSIRKLKYQDGIKIKEIGFADILTLINELESENERFRESCKNCHYIKDLEIANGHAKEFKDRIAELEKENEILKGTKDRLTFVERIKIADNSRVVALKQFAERLKEKLYNHRIWELPYEEWCKGNVVCGKIDETLKECIK